MFDILELIKNTVSSSNFTYNNNQFPWEKVIVFGNVMVKWNNISLSYIHYL